MYEKTRLIDPESWLSSVVCQEILSPALKCVPFERGVVMPTMGEKGVDATGSRK